MNYPTGKILFVVSLRGANGLWLLPQIKQTVLEDGYDGVALKVLHGFRWNGNLDDITEFFDKLRGKVQLYGWQWNLLEQPEKEAIWARKAVDEFRLNGFMSNPEGPAKKNPDAMRFYAKELKERFPNEAVGYTAYRYPSYHPEFPWDCLEFFDYHAPQVYWVLRHDPAEQLAASHKELIALKDMPVIPVGSAYTEPSYGNWKPTAADLKEFDAKCKSMGLMGCQWFTWRGAKPLDLLPVLKELNWEVDLPEPPAVDCNKLIEELKEEYAKEITNLNAVHQADLIKLQKTQALVLEASIKKAHNDALKSLIQPLLMQ
ncbi:hypothetical protein KA005_57505 [bacterium]|nr:hypothetical protein [bacterium]